MVATNGFVEKYLDAFPYSFRFFDRDCKYLFFIKAVGNGKYLHKLDLSQSTDLQEATKVSEEDFVSRAFIFPELDMDNNRLYLISDEDNRENFNLYEMDLSTGALKRLTNAEFRVTQTGFNKDFSWLLWGKKYRLANGQYRTTVFLRDMSTGGDLELIDDSDWDYKLSWGVPRFREDNTKAIFGVDWQNRRQKNNLIEVDLETGRWEKILPEDFETQGLTCHFRTYNQKEFYFECDKSGYSELYRFHFQNKTCEPLSQFGGRTRGTVGKVINGEKYLITNVPHLDRDESEIVVTPCSSQSSWSKVFRGPVHLSGKESGLWLYRDSLSAVPHYLEVDILEDFKEGRTLELCVGCSKDLVHNSYKFVKYTSYDGLEIPAYLSIPKKPVRGAVIIAFYGGENYYDKFAQMCAEKGIAYLSPAVRGSWGWGRDWEDKLKGDLGGGEILDLVWGAKFLEKELALKPHRIGLEGGSHGGYATLRAMTLPANFKGQESQYPWGFGVCWAGFADLVTFQEKTSIPDWTVNLIGGLEENRNLYIDRSPTTHFNELKSPLFVIHGSNDTRVPPEAMTEFLERLKTSSVRHEIIFEEGQGHTAGSKEQNVVRFERMFNFIESGLDQ